MRHAAGFAAVAFLLGGCSVVRYQNGGTIRVEESQNRFYSGPPHGRYWCLSTTPGVPVYVHGEGSPIVGYTREVIAFFGHSEGQRIQVVYYNGALGWMDGRMARPYVGPTPRSSCTIPGVDIRQRPVFVIR